MYGPLHELELILGIVIAAENLWHRPYRKPTLVILLSAHNKTPKDLSLHTLISTSLDRHQKSFILQSMIINTETHNWPGCRDREIVECLKGMSLSPPLTSDLWDHCRRGPGISAVQSPQGCHMYELTVIVGTRKGLHKLKPE